MKTVILCGGEGMRLRELTHELPKPLLDIGDRPILWHIMNIYASFGYMDFILCLGYKGDQIVKWFENNDQPGWNIEFAETGDLTPTGGRINMIQGLIGGDETFMVTYGDGLADISLKALLEFHFSKSQVATITVVHPRSRFGIIEIDQCDLVYSFMEKPKLDIWVNGGFFVFNQAIFKYLTDDTFLEKEPFQRLVGDKKIVAYQHHGKWSCMDTFKDYSYLNNLWGTKNAWWVM